MDALLAELKTHLRKREILPRTIYFGGGTPTALLADQLDSLLSGIHALLPLKNLEEWTVEANPATVRADKARILRDAGVNRVSLGVQSWNDATLKTLGRSHNSAQAKRTLDELCTAGIPAINIDLMFSVPGQTVQQWESDLHTTIEAAPSHVSAYCLTYEEDTEYFLKLTKGEYRQDESLDAQLFELTMDHLGAAGYRQYEISNHARPGCESHHNIACWEGREYLGLGPSAFSTLRAERVQNVCDTAEYVKRVNAGVTPEKSREPLDEATLLREKVAFGLRMANGVASELLTPWAEEKQHLLEIGLLEETNSRVRLTRRGRMLADAVGESFMGPVQN